MEQKARTRLKIENVSKTFYSKKGIPSNVIKHVSLEVFDNEFLVLLGPGHAGKSVLLNIISGLIPYDEGSVTLDGEQVEGPNPKIGMVFQKLGLMPWKTVMENVELGPKMRGIDVKTRREKAQYCIELVGLKGFENHYPHQLSGGMKQRVGIARALSMQPKVLLMDEPFGALDAMTRDILHDELEDLWASTNKTVLFVTHNVREAARLGDRVVLLTSRPGRVAEEFAVDIPRPRRIEDPDVSAIAKLITARLREEVARHGR